MEQPSMTKPDKLMVEHVSKAILKANDNISIGIIPRGTNEAHYVAKAAIEAMQSYKHSLLAVDLNSGVAITESGVYAPTKT